MGVEMIFDTDSYQHMLAYGREFRSSKGPHASLIHRLFLFLFWKFASVGGLICFLNG